MNNLPVELIVMILSELDLKNILKCELINRKFYSIIQNHVKINELIVSNSFYLPFNKIWFHRCELINFQNLIKTNCIHHTEFVLNQPLISNRLQHLYIYQTDISVKLLNRFDKLRRLEVSLMSQIIDDDCAVVKLSNLKVFCIQFFNEKHSFLEDLEFDLPSLQRLRIDGLKFSTFFDGFTIDFKLKDASNLIHLETKYLSNCKSFIKKAINLEQLYCDEIEASDLNSNLLKKLASLKAINFNGDKRAFEELIRQKQHLNKKLEVYYLSINSDRLPSIITATFQNVFYSTLYLDDQLIEYWIKNYDKLADVFPFILSINYNEIENYLHRLPNDFLSKFVNLYRLEVNDKIKDINLLINVLKECKTIDRLELHSVSQLNSILFDLCPNIVSLTIHKKADLDLNFVFQFQNLKKFAIYQELSYDFIRKFLSTYEVFEAFNFYKKGHYIVMHHLEGDSIYMRALDRGFDLKCVDDLIEQLEELDDISTVEDLEVDDSEEETSFFLENHTQAVV